MFKLRLNIYNIPMNIKILPIAITNYTEQKEYLQNSNKQEECLRNSTKQNYASTLCKDVSLRSLMEYKTMKGNHLS